ncbi:hypothetical protein G7B40_004930 [Aetokthonos hydrillicola Thurmond2011]|jgi:Ni/Co efflux regulator RcnB|uniref:Uncharacterized protein n=1 Tax=Aetokthonos hydrillicola Thurmond2011 TaxID=2712845 RepID=A0AAP5I2H9_9CYAN|nr:hypothetical protein [Aetokthonos hydrillicola]MBO3458294.1 hypothetical protein [Aetokthonos hydrillicola CCALA 1050]MBW4585856.1 hypothetical protein [Aetokthonos hydrillicola CCALA 1050]MDR9893918.1 hypothetical protein [Aetokthonos hydrillicola Thurmond2011]
MLKVVPLLMSIVATAAIAQPSVAMNPANFSPSPASEQLSSDLHAQLILNIGNSRSRRERDRQRARRRYQRYRRHQRFERQERRDRLRQRQRYDRRYR